MASKDFSFNFWTACSLGCQFPLPSQKCLTLWATVCPLLVCTPRFLFRKALLLPMSWGVLPLLLTISLEFCGKFSGLIYPITKEWSMKDNLDWNSLQPKYSALWENHILGETIYKMCLIKHQWVSLSLFAGVCACYYWLHCWGKCLPPPTIICM